MLLSSLRQALEGCAAGASGGSAAVVGARPLAPGVQPWLPQPTPEGLGGPVHAVVASNRKKRHSGNSVSQTLQSETFHLTPACTRP